MKKPRIWRINLNTAFYRRKIGSFTRKSNRTFFLERNLSYLFDSIIFYSGSAWVASRSLESIPSDICHLLYILRYPLGILRSNRRMLAILYNSVYIYVYNTAEEVCHPYPSRHLGPNNNIISLGT